jgi:autotransporter-associated beta strand protein
MKHTTHFPLALAAGLLLAFASMAQATVIVGTDFTGRTISSRTNCTVNDYTLIGVANPGVLSVTRVGTSTTNPTNLWDTADAQGYFAPWATAGSPRAHWQVDVPLVVGDTAINLSNVVASFQSFSAVGAKKTASALNHAVSVYLLDASDIVLASDLLFPATSPWVTWTNTFTGIAGQTLAANTTYKLRILVSSTTSVTTAAAAGNNVGMDFFTLNGALDATQPVKLGITDVNGGVNPTAGASYSVTVEAQDINGGPQNLSADTGVTISLAGGTPGSLGGTLTGTILNGTSSVIISGVTNRVAEIVTLQASTNSGTSLTAASNSYSIIPGSAVTLWVSGFPNPAATGLAGSVTVAAKDIYDNTDTNYTGTFTFTSSDGAATFSSNPYTFVTADAGAKTFNATLNTVGTQSITATDDVAPSITGSQSGIMVATLAAPPSVFSWTNATSGNWSSAANWTNDVGAFLAPPAPGETNYVVNFNQAGTYTATQNLNSGLLLNQLNFGGPALTLAGNRLTFTNNDATLPQINQNSAAAITVNTPLELGTNTIIGGTGNGEVNFQGEISGSGSLTKSGAGTVMLTTSNSYTGGTTISAGTLVVTNANGLSAGGVTNNATLNLVAPTVGSTVTYSAFPLAGSGTNNVKLGALSQTVTFLGDCSAFTGVWNIGVPAGSGTRFNLNGGNNAAAVYNLTVDSIVAINSDTVNYGTAYLYGGSLGGPLNYGQLQSASPGAQWAGPVILAGPVSSGGHIGAYGAGNTLSVSGPIGEINGSQSLAVWGNGTVYLAGTNTFTGNTTVSTITMVVANTLALQYSTLNKTAAAGSVQFASGIGNFTFGGLAGTRPLALDDLTPQPVALTVGGNGQNTTCSGVLSGSGSLTKVGAGTLRLTGVNLNTGLMTVSNGSLYISTASLTYGNVLVANGAKFGVINSVGAQSAVITDLTLGSSGSTTLSFTNVIDPATPLLTAVGTVALNGACTLAIENTNLVAGFTYPLLACASIVTNSGPGFSLSLPPGVIGTLTNDATGIALIVGSPINPYPPTLATSFDGTSLTLGWPTNAGWILQVQTNALNIGLGTNWVDVPGSDAVTSVTNSINPATGGVFYRMRLP